MRIVIQRVSDARVEVDGQITGSISRGLLVLLGIARTDSQREIDYMVDKLLGLRIFPDAEGKMNRSVVEAEGGVLIVSQFTLYGDCRRGRRPSFDAAAGADQARDLYEKFVAAARVRYPRVETGVFQASMAVHLVNDGPVTLVLDSVP